MSKGKVIVSALMAGILLLLAGCGSAGASGAAGSAGGQKETDIVKLGYFPNITHAPALVGLEKGFFQTELGNGVKLDTKVFPNGSLFMDALSTGQIDIGYVGPEPVLSRYLQGGDVVVLSGVATGGNVLVARKDSGIESIKDLEGKTVATPARGCTHDISLRILMQAAGLKMQDQGGTVKQVTQTPADMLTLFQQKQLDAAVVSEPWASQMEALVGAKVIVDASQMPWQGNLPSTVLVSTKKFVQQNPEVVKKILQGNVDAINFIQENPAEAAALINQNLTQLTKKKLTPEVVQKSLARTHMTSDLDPQILADMEQKAQEFKLVQGNIDTKGLVDLTLLKQVLQLKESR